MWFKNLQIFSLDEPFTDDIAQLSEQLAEQAFKPCPKSSLQSIGYFPPMGEEEGELAFAANGYILLCLKIQDKIIPSSVLREEVQAKVREIELKEDRKVSYKEKRRLKDDIHQELMLRAFCKSSFLYGYIDTKKNLLIVNAGSANKAELFVNTLRQARGHLKVSLLDLNSPSLLMTEWLKNQEASAGLRIEDFCELRDQDDLGSVRAKQQDILSDNIQAFLNDGCVVKQLRLNWQEQITFTLKDDFSIGSIKYMDAVMDQRDDAYTETAAQRFDADFAIMTATLSELVGELLPLFTPAAVSA